MIILKTFINQIKKNQILPCIVLNKKKEEEEKNREWISKKGDLTCSFLIEKKLTLMILVKLIFLQFII